MFGDHVGWKALPRIDDEESVDEISGRWRDCRPLLFVEREGAGFDLFENSLSLSRVVERSRTTQPWFFPPRVLKGKEIGDGRGEKTLDSHAIENATEAPEINFFRVTLGATSVENLRSCFNVRRPMEWTKRGGANRGIEGFHRWSLYSSLRRVPLRVRNL